MCFNLMFWIIYDYAQCVLPSAGELLSTQLITYSCSSGTVAKQPPIPPLPAVWSLFVYVFLIWILRKYKLFILAE